MELVIIRTWDGTPVTGAEEARLTLSGDADTLQIDVRAAFHSDPPPAGPPGPTPQLWCHEVVELFLVGDDARYTEIELGPHGHHLVLQLNGVRRVVAEGLPIDYRARIDGEVWVGTARVPRSLLPDPVRALNAYAIWGTTTRRYLAWSPVPGPMPDFHRLHLFPPLPRPLP